MNENANPDGAHDEAFVDDLCDALPDVFYAFDRDRRLHRWNSEVRERTGYADPEIAEMDPLEFVPESDRGKMAAAIEVVLERGETQTVESRLVTSDGERIPYEFNGSPVTDDGGTVVGVVGTGRNVSDRKKRARELQRYETLFETIDDGVYILDAEFRFASVNEAFAELSGYDPEELIGAPVSLITNEEGMERGERVATEMIDGERDVGVFEADHVTADGDRIPVETRFSLLPGDDADDAGDVVGVTRDVSDRQARERELRRERDRTQQLLETSPIGILLLDREGRVVEADDRATDVFGLSKAEIIGRTYDDPAWNLVDDAEDPVTADALPFRRTVENAESTYDVTLGVEGEDGERVWLSANTTPILDGDGGVSEVVATVTDVTERRRRERELARQRDELETFNRINVVIRDLVQALVSAASREDIEKIVCARLADSDLYRFAWVGDRNRDADGFVVRAEAGEDDGTREAVESATGTEWDRPATEAFRTGEIRAVNDIADSAAMPRSVWKATADEAVRSGVAVPVSFGGTVYGVLVVYATRPDAFGERERAGFEALGDLVGFAINAVESRRLLFADAVVEVTFRVADPDVPFVELTRELDCECRLEDIVPGEGETVLSFDRVTGAPPETVRERMENHPGVERARVVTAEGDECLLETRLAGSSPVVTLLGYGASATKAVTSDGEARVVAELAPETDVRSVVEAVTDEFADTELLRKREVERDVGTTADVRETLRDRLTDRQLAVLRATYRAGYFDWPRDSTAEEVADALGVSAATLHQHLRKAQKKLLDAFFEPE